MMNNGLNGNCFVNGFVPGEQQGNMDMKDFTWVWSLLMLFIAHAGPAPKVESIADFKKAIADFNDSVQAMELPEVTPDEN